MSGSKVTIAAGKLSTPDNPVLPFIEGDGTGPDIWASSVRVLDAAVAKAYGGSKKIEWKEVLAGEKAFSTTGDWLPEATLDGFKEYLIGIKGPLTTPIGGGIRSLNVALRQILDLYVCLRPVRYYKGVPSPVKNPEHTDMVIFRENTEDIYAGIEYEGGSEGAAKLLEFLSKEFPKDFARIRFGSQSSVDAWEKVLVESGSKNRNSGVNVGLGIKPVSFLGTERLVHSAISYAIQNGRTSVTLVHKGNIMKYTEGGFSKWGYQTAIDHFGAEPLDGGPWHVIDLTKLGINRTAADIKHVPTQEGIASCDPNKLIIKDVIADAFLQQILTRPAEYDVVATLNLNGDYVSDALAACVGGIGIAPGGNINYLTGHAIFEATHGTAPKYANQDKVNPGSVVLSGEMMLRHLGWSEAADLIIKGVEGAISNKRVTYDFHRLMEGATLLKCSEFGDEVISNM